MTKKRDVNLQRTKKRQLWLARVEQIVGSNSEDAEKLLLRRRLQSLRLNPLRLKDSTSHESQAITAVATPIVWCKHGYTMPEITLPDVDSWVEDGTVYIQNAASWLPVLVLDPQAGEQILDVCAAPGGKASHIQAITNNLSALTCNDNSKPRLMKLQRNMERLGAKANYTLCDATKLSRLFARSDLAAGSDLANGEGLFDKILLDAPCSGEGLMTLNPEDAKLFDSWSVAHIKRLSELQKKILHESWQLLKPGGTLVYSTCTMAPEENEVVVDYFLRKHVDAVLQPVDFPLENKIPTLTGWNGKQFVNDLSRCLRLKPGNLAEAFFVAKFQKR